MDERSGMGSKPRGPSFAPWYASHPTSTGAEPGGGADRRPSSSARAPAEPSPQASLRASPPAPPRQPPGPPPNPWPSLLTVIAIVVVGAVVLVSTVVGGRRDVRPTATRVPAPVTAPVSPAPTDRVEFVSSDGDGVLIITDRLWTSTGLRRPVSGTYLHVEVQLVCTSGQVAYGPENFSAFDATGELFEVSGGARWGTPLGYGTLWAGDSVRGSIAFDLPRGDVTLLMSDSSSRSVTALKIPD